jgi:D-galactarolactone cycloisomerase
MQIDKQSPIASFAGQPAVEIRRLQTFVFRATVDKPVVSSLARIPDRVSVLVRVEDRDGVFGWGEIYSTLPSYGAEHRAMVLHRTVAPLLLAETITDPAECWQTLSRKTHAWAIQTGEPGPVGAVLGGLDCALWDLFARRAGKPLCTLLGTAPRPVPAYASGLNPADGPEVVEQSRAQGFRAFKQKIGFGEEIDLSNLTRIRAGMRAGEALMVDVNQGWTLQQALQMAPLLDPFGLGWIEEPLQADRPADEWRQCAAAFSGPLAGGENLRGASFADQAQWLDVIQPDVGKWGGISGGWTVARAAVAAGKRYCPHWLGSGIGLMASAHLLAAAGGSGMLEVDVNENPLREALCQPFPELVDGAIVLSAGAGIGVEPDLHAASRWLAAHQETVNR